MTEPCDLSAVAARQLILQRKLSPLELLDGCLQRIERTNAAVNAIVAMDRESARRRAIAIGETMRRGEQAPLLAGLPVGIKDLQATKGLRTTKGSLLFADTVPSEDEASVARVRAAGANIFAKTNTPEFGAGGNTRNRVYGATGNPFAMARTCGGSSGGSAVAVALGQLPLATGSDLGGSLRTPASFCGVVGFRPSPGLVPANDRAQATFPHTVIGPMGRSVADAHLLLRAQLGLDKRDPFSSSDASRIPAELVAADLGRVRAAVSPDLGCAPVARAIAELFQARVKTFRHAFKDVEERAPDFTDVHEAFEVLRCVYFVAAHRARVEQSREKLDRNVIDNTERGLKLTLADVSRAHVAQTALYKRFMDFFADVDVLICPATSVPPFPHSELYVEEIDGQKMPTYMRWLAITYAPSTVLACAVALPCGLDHQDTPFGIQLIGPNGSDARILAIAHALEAVLAANPLTRRPLPDLASLGERRA
jgi:Asp-tRNA(Asn)/Glu-tRNA(Gln) amidotransferase A subunit family amidase